MEGTGEGYELLDAGVRRKLERFGALTIDRPAPGVDGFRLAPEAWAAADLRFDPGAGWSGRAWPAEPWTVDIEGLAMEVRPTASGGLGIYPEHAKHLEWLAAAVALQSSTRGAPEVLNLFAHTGLATLALLRAGAAVAHVDGARTAVQRARRNAELSGLGNATIRWLVDDAAAFVAREGRRRRRYDGIVLDPPAFGRAAGREWRLADDLPGLLSACCAVATDAAFVLLTSHSMDVDGETLRSMLQGAFGNDAATTVEPTDLLATSGARLHFGWAARRGA